MDAAELSLRPVRPADRERVLELVADVWEGHDYIPSVFDEWASDPAASFQAAEVDGELAGLQRLRPLSARVVFYEGLRVGTRFRRRGLARAMLRAAVEESRTLGFERMRLVTGNPDAAALFESEGFRRRTALRWWTAPRLEGGDPARIPSPFEAPSLMARLRNDPALAAYGGVPGEWKGPRDLDDEELARLAREGMVRVGAGGRSLAILAETQGGHHLRASLVAGSGAGFRDLLTALRFEADADDRDGVAVAAPEDHPSADDMRSVGYDFSRDGVGFLIFDLVLAS